MNVADIPYAGYRYPAEIISHAVWLYFRFALSFRAIEELLAARGIILTYDTIRQWCPWRIMSPRHIAAQFRNLVIRKIMSRIDSHEDCAPLFAEFRCNN